MHHVRQPFVCRGSKQANANATFFTNTPAMDSHFPMLRSDDVASSSPFAVGNHERH